MIKIKECVNAKKDHNFKIIARSDAKAVEGIDKMIDRCKAILMLVLKSFFLKHYMMKKILKKKRTIMLFIS